MNSQEIKELIKKDSPLFNDTRDYFSKNVHSGCIKPFGLERLTYSGNTLANDPLIHAIPENVAEEDIDSIDRNWSFGLFEIGKKYNVYIGLPARLYQK
jgi:hypothetical protein